MTQFERERRRRAHEDSRYSRWRRGLFHLATATADVGAYFLAVLLAYEIRFLGPAPAWNLWGFENITIFLALIPVLAGIAVDLYRIRWSKASAEDYLRVVQAAGVAALLLLVVNYVFRAEKAQVTELITGIPTLVVVWSFFTYAAIMTLWRQVLARVVRRLEGPQPPRRVLLVGTPAPNEAELFARLFGPTDRSSWPAMRALGYLGPRLERESAPDAPACLGDLEDLEDIIERLPVEEVLVVAPSLSQEGMLSVIRACERLGMPYRLVPSLIHMLTSRAQVELLNYVPLVHFGAPQIEGWEAYLKRLFDVGLAAILFGLSLPLLVVSALAIWIETGEFPIFVQERVGRGGRTFRMFKIRTMWSAEGPGPSLTVANDDRITRVGRFLRRSSVDELPQLLNVFKGDMSLVGPRAVVPEVAAHYDDLERMTLNVLPGITGLAQVSGRDELGFLDKSLLNLYYIKNHSILLDLVIIARTIGVVLSQEGTGGTRDDRGVLDSETVREEAPPAVGGDRRESRRFARRAG